MTCHDVRVLTADHPSAPAPGPFARPADLVVRLTPETVVILRGTEAVQVGLAPDRAVVVPAPEGCPARRLALLLRSLRGDRRLSECATAVGIDRALLPELGGLLEGLVEHGHAALVADPDAARAAGANPAAPEPAPDGPPGLPPIRRVHVLGKGALSHALRGPLQVNGCRVMTSASPGVALDPARPPWHAEGRTADLVILADSVVPDPVVTSALVRARLPHLHVHCREGRVVVGPTVLPGVTPCLRCTDLYRTDQDPQWPMVAAQLLGVGGTAPTPAITAALALVLAEVAGSRSRAHPPQTLGATIEISPAEGLWRRRVWPAHPRCTCGAAAATPAPLT